MFNVGAGEIAVILVLALIVLGPDKLPSAARQAGKYLSEFRRMSEGFQRELRDAMDFDGAKPQSGTMAPVKKAEVADVAEAERSAETTTDGEPVGESHRVIDSSNGPTLPPVMQPTVIPDAAPAPVATPATDPPAAAEPPAPTGPSAAVEVEGPSASFD